VSGADVDAWLAARPEDQRAVLQTLRDLLKTCLPDAAEVISYKMPGFRLGKTVIAGYAGFARNCGYYPHSGNIVPQFAAELGTLGFRHTNGAITFTPARPLPDDLVRRLVAARLEEIAHD
jgi:uncharacterized protein YdhG (YjbR/CyaY superfamily)